MRRLVAVAFVVGSLGLSAVPSGLAGAAAAAPGRYIVVLDDAVSDPGSVAREHGRRHEVTVSHVYRHALKGYAAAIPAGRLDDIRSDPRVAYVESDAVAAASAKPGGGGTTKPPPPQTVPAGIAAVGATTSTTVAGDGSGSVDGQLWVIDTGVDAAHTDLNVVEFKNFVGGPNKDCNGHGTHVAGTAAARDNASYVVGVAPGAAVHAVKVLGCNGSGSYSAVIAGVDYVTGNAAAGSVANMSLGGPVSTALDDAVRRSAAAGVLYVLAAGNESVDACTTSPARTGEGTDNGIITVGAVDGTGDAAYFSNAGTCVDLWAPGVQVLSTWPGSTTKVLSGTSMASPHVAGGGTLLRSGLALSPPQTEAALKAAAEPNGGLPFLDVSGY